VVELFTNNLHKQYLLCIRYLPNILTKNSEQYLDEILSKIEPVMDEIIIVDSGSTDNTERIVSKYSKAKLCC
jgi:Glycosyltransferases involved in cell wall biogenesis